MTTDDEFFDILDTQLVEKPIEPKIPLEQLDPPETCTVEDIRKTHVYPEGIKDQLDKYEKFLKEMASANDKIQKILESWFNEESNEQDRLKRFVQGIKILQYRMIVSVISNNLNADDAQKYVNLYQELVQAELQLRKG